jgi:antibiotic biosynthesis monooxygenase (ABM) superfamily enzyme
MSAEPTVTVLVTRVVAAGREADYDAWVHGVGEAARTFAGHQGLHAVRPLPGSQVRTLVFRFATAADLAAWEASPLRRDWVARADALCSDTTVQRLTGLEGWFPSPDPAIGPPPRWKMAVVTFAVAFPTIQTLQWLLLPRLDPLPAPARGAVIGLAMVVFMTYVAMPMVTRRLSGWLYAPRAG